MNNKEKLIKEIGYEKSQLLICYSKISQIIGRLNELQIYIDNLEFE